MEIFTSILANLTTCYYYLGDSDKALENAQRAVESDSNESTGYRIKGCLYFSLGRVYEAREAWETAMQKRISTAEKEAVQQWLNAVPES